MEIQIMRLQRYYQRTRRLCTIEIIIAYYQLIKNIRTSLLILSHSIIRSVFTFFSIIIFVVVKLWLFNNLDFDFYVGVKLFVFTRSKRKVFISNSAFEFKTERIFNFTEICEFSFNRLVWSLMKKYQSFIVKRTYP